jgi:hypothetical protein
MMINADSVKNCRLAFFYGLTELLTQFFGFSGRDSKRNGQSVTDTKRDDSRKVRTIGIKHHHFFSRKPITAAS